MGLEESLQQAVKDGKLPHAIVAATNASGSFKCSYTAGYSDLSNSTAIDQDSVLQFASSTKLLTSIASLQIVERGLIGLDDDLAPHLPELAAKKIIRGFDENDKPILEDRKNAITLRHLLTHSSGVAYEDMHNKLKKFRDQKGREDNWYLTVLGRYDFPLLFEPGESWMYGANMDWMGRLIERLTGMSLEDYMKKNIWEPLGITDLTFWPDSDMQSRVCILTTRTPEGDLAPFNKPFLNTGSKDCFGGHGLFGTVSEYLKVQRSLLANDGKLLQPRSVDMMFTPQLSPKVKAALNRFLTVSGNMVPGNPNENESDWGLGSLIFLKNQEGRRNKGTLHWGGIANTWWTIDRETDLALSFGTQVLPPGDGKVAQVIEEVERAVYQMLDKQSK